MPRNERACHVAVMDRHTTPSCPSCSRVMSLKRTIPGIGGLPQLRVYSCQYCGVSLTEADEPTLHVTGHTNAVAGQR
jgi:hypothetical protein